MTPVVIQFDNERGNTVRVSVRPRGADTCAVVIDGPRSIANNIVTHIEAAHLLRALSLAFEVPIGGHQFRKRLPNRRPGDTWRFKSQILGNKTVHLTDGRYVETGEMGELFIAGPKIGTDMDSMMKEWATLLSLARQWGMPLHEYADNVQRDPRGRPLTVFGEIMDELMRTTSNEGTT